MVWAPSFSFLLITFLGILAGNSPKVIFEILEQKCLILVLSLWLLWPVAHVVNYFLIPPNFRQVFLNLVQIISNIVSSLIVHA
jgi:protein Mpv17